MEYAKQAFWSPPLSRIYMPESRKRDARGWLVHPTTSDTPFPALFVRPWMAYWLSCSRNILFSRHQLLVWRWRCFSWCGVCPCEKLMRSFSSFVDRRCKRVSFYSFSLPVRYTIYLTILYTPGIVVPPIKPSNHNAHNGLIKKLSSTTLTTKAHHYPKIRESCSSNYEN